MTPRRRLTLVIWGVVIIVLLALGIPRWIKYGYAEIGVWVAALSTLAIFSFLYEENAAYRLAEHLMLGTSIGFAIGATIMDILRPNWWVPMLQGFETLFGGTGGSAEVWGAAGAIFFGVSAGVIGLLWYGLFHPKTLWLSRLVMGIVMGGGAGLAIKQQFVLNVPQVTASFKSPIVLNDVGGFDAAASINNTIFLVALLLTINFFFFSFDHSRKIGEWAQGLLDRFPVGLRWAPGLVFMLFSGRFWLMLAFGVFFGNTVMTRLSVFIERVWYLVDTWARPLFSGVSPVGQ
ncbi:MAG: hypothetical protein HRF45_10685 [Fimbriimonadia bacterium]|jgi:hypothetical protein